MPSVRRHLPENIPKRGLSLDEAAEYCGVSPNSILRHGPKPSRIGERNIYDRKALDLWLDKAAGIGQPSAPTEEDNPLRAAILARKNAVRHKAA